MKRIMFVGSIGCGKTTLCQRIIGEELQYNKTQAVEFYPKMVDTPGEFIQHRRFYNALQVMAAEVDIVALVANVMEEEQVFSPNFAQNMMKPCIGIITKMDACRDETQVEQAEQRLRMAGVERIFKLSALEDRGVTELVDYLKGESFDADLYENWG